MLLSVRHETTYAYDGPASHISQILRLTPRAYDGQRVLDWRVTRSDGAPISTFTDGLGNICGFASRRGPTTTVTIAVSGRVRTEDCEGLVRGGFEPLPPAYFLRSTAMTAATEKIRALAHEAMKPGGAAGLIGLAAAVRERIAPAPEATPAEASAGAALDAGRGVCHDYAHVFVSAARAAGAPARYVGGYVLPEGPASLTGFAPHAWAEAWAPELGWIGFDPSRGGRIGASYVRLAIGLDYRQAAPISGLWRGQGKEAMSVAGAVELVDSDQ
jgi:transglutaminase-like putative cysteine protease